jgi:cytochrome P450
MDLARLAARLNELGAKYVVLGGFAIVQAGLVRNTMDLDLLVDCSPENDAAVRKALEILPDQAVLELEPGEIERYEVVRVCDEFTVDLMASACGYRYRDVEHLIQHVEYQGVTIPFASPALLWLTKQTCRERDAWDREFLRKLLVERGEWPVE